MHDHALTQFGVNHDANVNFSRSSTLLDTLLVRPDDMYAFPESCDLYKNLFNHLFLQILQATFIHRLTPMIRFKTSNVSRGLAKQKRITKKYPKSNEHIILDGGIYI